MFSSNECSQDESHCPTSEDNKRWTRLDKMHGRVRGVVSAQYTSIFSTFRLSTLQASHAIPLSSGFCIFSSCRLDIISGGFLPLLADGTLALHQLILGRRLCLANVQRHVRIMPTPGCYDRCIALERKNCNSACRDLCLTAFAYEAFQLVKCLIMHVPRMTCCSRVFTLNLHADGKISLWEGDA